MTTDCAAAPPRRRVRTLLLPPLVAVVIGGMVVWTAWPALRPVPTVSVAQAVFVPASSPAASAGGADGRAASTATVQAPGWLEADPFYVACTALADGVIESIEVLEGDGVERGQVVARLVARDAELRLAMAEAMLASAEAELALAVSERRAAQEVWDEPVERTRAVLSGRAALAEGVAELERLPHLIASARATLVRLDEEAVRFERSLAAGGSTDLEAITARQQAEAQRAVLASLEAERPVLSARVERLRADLGAAERHDALRTSERRRLDTAVASVARAEAGLLRARAERDEAALELERMVIVSPISGVVQRRLKVPGDKVMLGMDDAHSAHVLHVYDPSSIQVRVDVPLADASNVSVGQRCEVVVEVLPETAFAGEVTRVTHEADLLKNTLQAKVRVIDPSPLLRPEMLTRVTFLPGEAGETGGSGGSDGASGGSARVPTSSLMREAASGPARVLAVRDRRDDRGVVRSVEVRVVGAERDGWVTVSGGVRPGDLLASPAVALAEGARVRVVAFREGVSR